MTGPCQPADLPPLDLVHQPILAPLLAATRCPLSEYSFANLYLFRRRHDYRVLLGDTPAVLGITYDGVRHAMPLTPLTGASAKALLEVAQCLYPIPEDHGVEAAGWGLRGDWRDADSDYVYRRQDLANLSRAKERRAQARRFARDFAPTCQPLSPALAPEALAVLAGWMEDTGRAPGETDDEACAEALDRWETLDLNGLLVRTGAGTPVGLLIASRGADGSQIVHFAKGRRDVTGVYPWMFAEFAARTGAAELNFEQDLGNPGFAQSKRAFAPFLRRHKLRLRRAP